MKLKRTTAALLVVALCLSLLLPSAGALNQTVPNVGTLYKADKLMLGDQTQLTQTTLQHQSSGVQEERYIEWASGADIRAIVVGGSTVYGDTMTMNTLQQRMQSQGREMVAALNGGYFSMSSGVQDGVLITDGILRATDNFYQYVGFPASGGAFIGSSPMYINMTAQIGGQDKRISIDQVNHTRTSSRLILFTPDFAADTKTSTAGKHVVLNVNGPLRVGGTVTGTVDRVVTGKDACALKSGQMVLSVADTGPKSRLDGLAAGVTFSISVTCAETRLSGCPFVIGGYQKLLTGGKVVSGLAAGTAPRTAVGIKADGTTVFYAVDGRQSGWSVGLSLTSLAVRLQSLGCVEAINLDGGGSTIFGARYPGQNNFTITNKPSDGSQRKVADYIVLVNDMPKLGTAGRLFIYPNTVTMLQGASTSFSTTATDENYHPVTVPPVSWWTDDEAIGVVSESGRFTAVSAGTSNVSVTSATGAIGGAVVRVVGKPDSLQFVNNKTGNVITSLSPSPGETINLSVRAMVDNRTVINQNNCFTWTVDGMIGSVDANGVFSATSASGASGTIRIDYNGMKISLPVTVGTRPTAIETFENGSTAFTWAPGISFLVESDLDLTKYGLRAGRVTYDFGETNTTLTLPVNLSLPSGSKWLSLWVSGDNSKNRLELTFATSSGTKSLSVGTLDFTGYQKFHIQLPSGASKVTGFRVVKASGGAAKGRILTDQWVTSAQRYEGTQPPVVSFDSVTLSSDGSQMQVEARAVEASGLPLAAGSVTLLRDGVAQTISYNTTTGRISVSLPAAALLPHRLTLEAIDSSGNRSRVTFDLGSGDNGRVLADVPFDDLSSTHWANPNIAYLCALGILDGPSAAQMSFFPDRALTRADMAIYTARFLKIDLSKYSNVSLPFTDLSQIPQNALPSIRALYSLGVVKGKERDGKPFYDPFASITRAEFCTILSRGMPRGHATQTLNFSDTGNIPSYARIHIQTMVSLGVVAGYPDNTVRAKGNITRAETAKILHMLY